LGKKGPGIVNLFGLLKIKKVEKPATKQRKGRNPLTGEEITIKAKPKRTVVKVQALKSLKDMI
jgi:nucleoid DNA-binding protein